MTGSTNKLLARLNQNLATNEQIIESALQKKHNEGLMKTVLYLRRQAKSGDIASMLEDERLILSHALEFSANSPQEKNSLKSAIAQLDEGRHCFEELVANPDAYNQNQSSFSTKRKQAGLPLDAAREFFQSHSTRLDNRLAGKSSHFEKLLFTQRKDNLHIIKNAYVELQRKALGLEAPQKKQGLSR
jgi:hypothetical protein